MVGFKVIIQKLEMQYASNKQLAYKNIWYIIQFIVVSENIMYMEYILQKIYKISTFKTTA